MHFVKIAWERVLIREFVTIFVYKIVDNRFLVRMTLFATAAADSFYKFLAHQMYLIEFYALSIKRLWIIVGRNLV